ncbi:MAG TPA: hypothetical protein ENH75_03590 [archaeon]|nr:hypothetical protein [archaeon]
MFKTEDTPQFKHKKNNILFFTMPSGLQERLTQLLCSEDALDPSVTMPHRKLFYFEGSTVLF